VQSVHLDLKLKVSYRSSLNDLASKYRFETTYAVGAKPTIEIRMDEVKKSHKKLDNS